METPPRSPELALPRHYLPCVGNFTCENFGSCRHDNTSGSLYCDCLPGYAGERCGIEKNLCDDDPCPTNSVCLRRVNGFLCKCTRSSDPNCENTVEPPDPCGSHKCPDDDACIPLFNQYYCNCPTVPSDNALNEENNCGKYLSAEITRPSETPENGVTDGSLSDDPSSNVWWFLVIGMAAVLLIVFVTVLTYAQCSRKEVSSNK